ncbi:MAG: GGDEF domain-containing protein, partial [Marinobacter sp. 34-60-7]
MRAIHKTGQPGPTDAEERHISRLLNGLSVMAVLFLIGIGVKAWYADHQAHAWVLWLFTLPVIGNMLWFAVRRNQAVQKAGLLITVGLLFTYLIATGGEGNTGPLWFYVFPPLLFYLTSLKGGTAILLFCYLLAVLVFQYPDLPGVTASYSADFKIRFFATLTFESVFCFVLEASRLRARENLVSLANTHEQAAKTDELTGLANRRDMQNRLTEEYARYQRSGRHFSVVLIDLDLFKRINDDFGHDAGDQVLRTFAGITQEVIRQADTAARWGGEEFLVICSETPREAALSLAQRLLEQVRSKHFEPGGRLTVSAGVACLQTQGGAPDGGQDLFQRADQ